MAGNKLAVTAVVGAIGLGALCWLGSRTKRTTAYLGGVKPNRHAFGALWVDIAQSVDFNPEWDQDEGGYTKSILMDYQGLTNGQRVRSIDPQGRRIIIIGTRYGNVAFYESSLPEEDMDVIIFHDAPVKLRKLLLREEVSPAYLRTYAGRDNIGTLVEELTDGDSTDPQ